MLEGFVRLIVALLVTGAFTTLFTFIFEIGKGDIPKKDEEERKKDEEERIRQEARIWKEELERKERLARIWKEELERKD